MTSYTVFHSPLQPLLLTSDGVSLTGLHLGSHKHGLQIDPAWTRADDAPLFVEAKRQLTAYFDGRLEEFDLPLALEGTPFQQRVWEELVKIPYGTTISYGELARRIGQ